MLEFTQDEQEYVLEVLRSAHTELLRDLTHADSRDFRLALRGFIELNEQIIGKVSGSAMPIHESAWMRRPADV